MKDGVSLLVCWLYVDVQQMYDVSEDAFLMHGSLS